MAWTTPEDWDYKEAPGSDKLNEQVRDNLNYLKASLPAGVMIEYGGTAAPDQWLLCNGAAVSRTTYAALFAAIGVTFGVGDGSITFNVPDSRGRTTVGAGQGSGLTNRALAATIGTETHTLTENELASHTHIQNQHRHAYSHGSDTTSSGHAADTNSGSPTQYTEYTTPTNQNTGGGAAHNNMQPSLAVTKIIKY